MTRLQGTAMFLLDQVHRWKANGSKYIPFMLWVVLITGKFPISPNAMQKFMGSL